MFRDTFRSPPFSLRILDLLLDSKSQNSLLILNPSPRSSRKVLPLFSFPCPSGPTTVSPGGSPCREVSSILVSRPTRKRTVEVLLRLSERTGHSSKLVGLLKYVDTGRPGKTLTPSRSNRSKGEVCCDYVFYRYRDRV